MPAGPHTPPPAETPLPLPTFLVIGAQKSATTWLAWNLGRHPEVFTAPAELMFFNNSRRFHRLGVDWYREQFRGWQGEPIVGEATAGYLMLRHKPEVVSRRIHDTVPDARLVALLRDPVDRAQSAMIHHIRRRRLPLDSNLLDLVRQQPELCERHNLVSGGLYAQSLRPFLDRFGEQLLVVLHDDVRHDPRQVYVQVLRHIGADPGFVPEGLERARHSNQDDGTGDDPGRSGTGPSGPLRTGLATLRRAKHRVLRQSRTADELSTPPLTAAERRELYRLFDADIDDLEPLIGRDLSAWRPAD